MTKRKFNSKEIEGVIDVRDLTVLPGYYTTSFEPYNKNLYRLHKVPKFKLRYAR